MLIRIRPLQYFGVNTLDFCNDVITATGTYAIAAIKDFSTSNKCILNTNYLPYILYFSSADIVSYPFHRIVAMTKENY